MRKKTETLIRYSDEKKKKDTAMIWVNWETFYAHG